MKNRLHRLSKEEQKAEIERYKKERPEIASRFKKLRTVSIVGIVYSIIALGVDFYLNSQEYNYYIQNLVIDCVLLVFCVAFLIASKNFLEKQVNSFLVNELHEKQKKQWEAEKIAIKKTAKKSTKKTTKDKKEKVKKNGKTTKSNR